MENDCKELPKYQSHKIVQALKIKSIYTVGPETNEYAFDPEDETFGRIELPNDFVAKHSPQAGGYWVRYPDGYESYSPSEAFESGYTLI